MEIKKTKGSNSNTKYIVTAKTGERITSEDVRSLVEESDLHGCSNDGSYIPDWMYNGHYDCGDK